MAGAPGSVETPVTGFDLQARTGGPSHGHPTRRFRPLSNRADSGQGTTWRSPCAIRQGGDVGRTGQWQGVLRLRREDRTQRARVRGRLRGDAGVLVPRRVSYRVADVQRRARGEPVARVPSECDIAAFR